MPAKEVMEIDDFLNETDFVSSSKVMDIDEFMSEERQGLIDHFGPQMPGLFPEIKEFNPQDIIAKPGETFMDVYRRLPRPDIGVAFATGVIPVGKTEAEKAKIAQEHPIAYMVGNMAGLIAVGTSTAGIGPAITLSKSLAALPTLARIAAGRMVQTSVQFGLKELSDQMAEIVSGDKKSFGKVVGAVGSETAFGAGLGGVGVIPAPLARIPAEAAYGFTAAKLQGASNLEAGVSAALFAVLGSLNLKNYNEAYRNQAVAGARRAFIDRMRGMGVKPEIAEQAARRYFAYLEKTLITDKSGKFKPLSIKDYDEFAAKLRGPFKRNIEPLFTEAISGPAAPKATTAPAKGMVQVKMPASPTDQALMQEALKYKTAEEFEKAFLQHATDNPDLIRKEGIKQGQLASDVSKGGVLNKKYFWGKKTNKNRPDVNTLFLVKPENIPEGWIEDVGGIKRVQAGGSISIKPDFEVPIETNLTDIWKKAHGVSGGQPPVSTKITPKTSMAPQPSAADARPPAIPEPSEMPLKERIKNRIAEIEEGKITLSDLEDELQVHRDRYAFFRGRVRKYGDNYLAEELKSFPRRFFTKEETASTPDKAMQEFNAAGFGVQLNTLDEFAEFVKGTKARIEELRETIKTYKTKMVKKREVTFLKGRLADIEAGIKEGVVKTKQQAKAVQEGIIAQLEGSELTPGDRAKFIRTIKNIQTVKELNKRLPEVLRRIGDLTEQAAKRNTINAIRAELKETKPRKAAGRVVGKYGPEGQKILDSMREALKLTTEQAQAQIKENIDKFPDGIPDIETAMQNRILDMIGNRDQQTSRRLGQTLEAIQGIKAIGRAKMLDDFIERQERLDQRIDAVTAGLGPAADIDAVLRILKDQNTNLAEMTAAKLKDFVIIHMRPELKYDLMQMSQEFEALVDADNNYKESFERNLKKIEAIHEGINIAEAIDKKRNVGRFEGITKDQMMAIYAYSFNDDSMFHLMATGITDEDVSDIARALTSGERSAVESMIQLYDERLYAELNSSFEELFGISLPKAEKYFPIRNLGRMAEESEVAKRILEQARVRKASAAIGAIKSRIGSNAPFKGFEYFNTIYKNLSDTEHFKAFGEVIRDTNAMVQKLKQPIEDKFGKLWFKEIDRHLKDVAYGGDKAALTWLEELSRWVRTNYVVQVLGANLSTVAKQPISYMQGAEWVGKAAVMKGTFKFVSDPNKWSEFVDGKSLMMKHRMLNQERDYIEMLNRRGLAAKLGRSNIIDMIRKGSLMPIQIADKTTCNIIWLSAYDKAISEGETDFSAISIADKAIRRTQPMGGTLFLPAVFRSNEVARLYTLFKNQPNQNLNLAIESGINLKHGKIGFGKFAMQQLMYMIIPAFLLGIISRKRLPDQEENEFVKDMVNQYLGPFVILGNITNSMASGYWGGVTPLEGTMGDVQRFITGKKFETKAKAAFKLSGLAIGFPTVAVSRVIDAIQEKDIMRLLGKPRKSGKGKRRKAAIKRVY